MFPLLVNERLCPLLLSNFAAQLPCFYSASFRDDSTFDIFFNKVATPFLLNFLNEIFLSLSLISLNVSFSQLFNAVYDFLLLLLETWFNC
jgi:hypothetical protein